MSSIFELFGFPPDNRSEYVEQQRRQATCPFTNSRCDGGGNRYQTAIDLDDSPELQDYFNDELDTVVPGTCSLAYGGEQWIVCPRRLMGFKHEGTGLPGVNEGLQPHERDALIEGGLPRDAQLGVWPEVYIRYSEENININYQFDFIIAPLQTEVPLDWVFQTHNLRTREHKEEVIDAARRGNWVSGTVDSSTHLPVAPDLDSPFIVEVMTASTSGSDRSRRTDIASSFEDAILQRDHEGPGINKRQVWGRMATQLFAKSALAEKWQGQALWIVQEELVKSVELTTQLSVTNSKTADQSTINFVWMNYSRDADGPALEYSGSKRIAAGVNFSGDQTCADILIPKTTPPKRELLKAVLRSNIAARISL